MIDVEALRSWLATLSSRNCDYVAIDDGGLTLLALGPDQKPTGPYIEIGGTPANEEDTSVINCRRCESPFVPVFHDTLCPKCDKG